MLQTYCVQNVFYMAGAGCTSTDWIRACQIADPVVKTLSQNVPLTYEWTVLKSDSPLNLQCQWHSFVTQFFILVHCFRDWKLSSSFIFILLLLLHNIEYHAQIGMTRQEKKKNRTIAFQISEEINLYRKQVLFLIIEPSLGDVAGKLSGLIRAASSGSH